MRARSTPRGWLAGEGERNSDSTPRVIQTVHLLNHESGGTVGHASTRARPSALATPRPT